MVKNILHFIVFSLLIFSCTDKGEPETIYGKYVPLSITSDTAMDITGAGVVSVDLLEQLVGQFSISIKTSGAIFLHLYTPKYFNVNFSQVLLRLPHHYEFENKVNVEFYQNGRRFDIEENGEVKLSWNNYVDSQQFKIPEQLKNDIVIESLKINSVRVKTVELRTAQRWYDHSVNDWVEAKMIYTFIKEN